VRRGRAAGPHRYAPVISGIGNRPKQGATYPTTLLYLPGTYLVSEARPAARVAGSQRTLGTTLGQAQCRRLAVQRGRKTEVYVGGPGQRVCQTSGQGGPWSVVSAAACPVQNASVMFCLSCHCKTFREGSTVRCPA
jgi:hypothetical protein